jgi:hypothetical protein
VEQAKPTDRKGSLKTISSAGCQWLTPIILATQEAEIRRIVVQSQPRQTVRETYLEKLFTKIGLVEWLKVKALSSSTSTTKKNKIKTISFRRTVLKLYSSATPLEGFSGTNCCT